ncbi:CMRF35-like molecule 9 isoform X2 [Equus asinus]|uniref:CMRF35-like molecule 9 isoform X2 n=1 Tax=Equus asinus TaxID=9793 RepID=UPI0038F5E14A
MWLFPALLLLIIPGCFSIHGPGTVSGPEGGSVTIECHYNSGWETYKKWWGRGNAWRSCRILVKTTGSEQEVKKDRVSIKDDHRCRTFAVTMEKLRSDDEDTYWCGIERYGIDQGVQVKVTVGPAYTTTPPTLLITNTTESMTTDQSEPMTPASLTSSSPVTQSVNNSPASLTSSSPVTQSVNNSPASLTSSSPVTQSVNNSPASLTSSSPVTQSVNNSPASLTSSSPVTQSVNNSPASLTSSSPVTQSVNNSPASLTSSSPVTQSVNNSPASLTSSSPVTQSVNNSQPLPLTSPLIRVLLCNIHFVLLTSMKVSLLGILLCTVMWLSRSQRDSRGKQRQSEQENHSSHAIDTLTPEEQTSGTS